jgi:predicted enzyme related to lactoylglutathione lyase
MTTRNRAPAGAPCWADLWTSDVEGSRRFYGELFGWEAQAPDPNFGGYFMFERKGAPVAGAMGDMGDMKANNAWKPYFATADINKTVELATGDGAQLMGPVMPVGDAGTMTVLVDPTGAPFGLWQAGQFPGFTTLEEPGAPTWFELLTTGHARALDFYRAVFGWETVVVGDTDDFRYTTARAEDGGDDVAGVMDASRILPEGSGSQWHIYWEVDDVAATVAKVKDLGGSVLSGPEDTPYGVLAHVADPSGAHFKLRHR